MNRTHFIVMSFGFYVILAVIISGCQVGATEPVPTTQLVNLDRPLVESPGGSVIVALGLDEGSPYYRIEYKDQQVILPSKLGFVLKDGSSFNQNLKFVSAEIRTFDKPWTQVWGEVEEVSNHYNELRVTLREQTAAPREMMLVFRVYDDGVGFRYEFPEQEFLKEFEIQDEVTEFVMSGNHKVWFIPAYQRNRYEYLYLQKTISWFGGSSIRALHTPVTMETETGLFLTIHEANLTDYAAMSLAPGQNFTLSADLAPWSDGTRVKGAAPMETPWRTIQIEEQSGELITNNLILNLNEPNVLENTSWIKPGKYVGVWWEIHLDISTWGSGPKHGATTENVKRYIDFASENGFDGVLVEGWNTGWDGEWWGDGRAIH
ncbi:glycoside hydrolase family 97 N-terminal domain-containing protein [Chloroflexota bacterium]